MYGNIIYDKSPVILEMLIKKMGKESFRKGIQEYLKTYTYGNATWEGLIGILDKYTDDDLTAWSRVWVNEKGMPEICGVISEDGKSLQVSQKDPLGRGLLWEQDLSFLVVYPDGGTEDVQVSFGKGRRAKAVSSCPMPMAKDMVSSACLRKMRRLVWATFPLVRTRC